MRLCSIYEFCMVKSISTVACNPMAPSIQAHAQSPIPAQKTAAMPQALAYACLALSMALVGSYVALSKPLVAALPVFLLAWLRFGIGVLAMLPWLRKPPGEAALSRRTQGLLFLESLLGNFLFSIFMLYGVSMGSAVSAGTIMAAIPAVVALLSWAFLRERIGLRVCVAIACAAAGMALLALSKTELHTQIQSASTGIFALKTEALGRLFLGAAVVCEAAYAVIGKLLGASLSPKRICALINLWGFALMTPLGLWQALRFDFAVVHVGTWLLLVFYALAASVWSVWLWMTGLAGVSAARAGVFTVMLPVSAALVGVLVLGEPMGGLQLLAFGLALLGVVLATLPQRTPTQA